MKNTIKLLVMAGVFFVVVRLIVYTQSNDPCNQPAPPIVSTDVWSTGDTPVKVSILWQVSEQHKRLPGVMGGPTMDGLAVSNERVLYIPEESGCEMSKKISTLDLATGKPLWSAKIPDNIRDMKSTSSGFMVTTYNHVISLSPRGGKLWDYSTERRTIASTYEGSDGIYVFRESANLGVLLLSPESGNLLRTMNNVWIDWSDYALQPSDAAGEAILVKNGSEPVEIARIGFSDSPRSVARFGDLLLDFTLNFQQRKMSIKAYNIATGELLYSLYDQPLYDSPTVRNGVLFIYTHEGLALYDAYTGKSAGTIPLIRTANGKVDKDISTEVWLDGYDDTLVIRYVQTFELIALKIDFSTVQLDNNAG